MRKTTLVILLGLLLPLAAQAAPSPCRFGAIAEKATEVDIAAEYGAADLVAIGSVTGRDANGSNLVFQVDQFIKGAAGKQIILHGQQALNTEMNGFALPGNRPVLVLLKSGADGVYDNVEEYNSPCNIVYFVKEDKVVLVEKDEHNPGTEVAVKKVKEYLTANPPKLAYNY